MIRFVPLGLALAVSGHAAASVAMPSLFSDHMVLQRDVPLRIWGWGTPGESVGVALTQGGADHVHFDHSANVAADGQWEVVLPPARAGVDYTLHVSGSVNLMFPGHTLQFKDVAVGDVWVCSGQSNMEWGVASSNNAPAEIAAADHPNIRLFTVPRRSSEHPMADAYGTWARCSPKSIPRFSAVGYYFGRELLNALGGVPIGLINSSWGGTPAEAWTPRATLRSHATFAERLDKFLGAKKLYPALKAAYDSEMIVWRTKPEAERGAQPRAPGGAPGQGNTPGGLYQGMIAPLVKFPVRGAIWYQGESNAGEPELYAQLFPAMITAWREAWNRPDLPFYFVQLANFEPGANWGWIREAQMAALRLAHTGAAITIDIGEARDIHPKNKQDVGKRLALQALAGTYRKPVTASGPMLLGMRVEGSAVRVTFSLAKGLNARGGAPTGFEIAGSDRKFHPATARIEGETVVVSAPEVPSPTAVRYAWAGNPAANLYGGTGLPALPFRTDSWPRL